MSKREDSAGALPQGEARGAGSFARRLIRPERDNLVARPWGGTRLQRFKRLPDADAAGGPFGESFEISACDSDPEARQFPSRVRLDDGSEIRLSALLEANAASLLGEAFLRRHGTGFPLLPKLLSVRELLSVQGHPEGNTEVYVIVDAEPGATLRLGFRQDVDAVDLGGALSRGLEQQRELEDLLRGGVDPAELQQRAAPWFADRRAATGALAPWLSGHLDRGGMRSQALALLNALKALYWQMLDALNEIPVQPGLVIHNATPQRLLADTGRRPSAEVHALGNPEGREILALEIRRPGPTFRAWDNVRFPRREVDVAGALAALNLRATRPEEFMRPRLPVAGRPGTFVSVDTEQFRVEHLMPAAGQPVSLPAAGPQSLHCLAGEVAIAGMDGRSVGTLGQGESALVPVGVGGCRITADVPAELVRVTLPEA